MADILLVGGRFDREGGRTSGFISKLAQAVLLQDTKIDLINGGSMDDLSKAMEWAGHHKAVWWWPDIDNSEPKLVGALKDMCPKSVLVISKNNRSSKYDYLDLVSRMLKARANLMLELRGTKPPFKGSIIDPLGNAFLLKEGDITEIAKALLQRTQELIGFTRVGSVSVGPAQEAPSHPEIEVFLQIVRGYAGRFHELVHAANQDRFLGNASFRCTQGGFPAFRVDDDLFYVSRRNIDKRDLATEGFVAARLADTEKLEYFGDVKPSVDAPIQRELFRMFPEMRFMLHAHVYVEGARYTKSRVPCGAIDEVAEIVEAIGPAGLTTRRANAVNLRGHGCLIMAHMADHLDSLNFIARPLPETISGV